MDAPEHLVLLLGSWKTHHKLLFSSHFEALKRKTASDRSFWSQKNFFTKIDRGVNMARKQLSEVRRALGGTTTMIHFEKSKKIHFFQIFQAIFSMILSHFPWVWAKTKTFFSKFLRELIFFAKSSGKKFNMIMFFIFPSVWTHRNT